MKTNDDRPRCVDCDKPLRKPMMCNYDNQTDTFISPTDETEESGWQYIGPDCARKRNIPRAWLKKELNPK